MALHFSPEEFDRRKGALLAAMAQARLDGLLMFQQESMYWPTGYDTFGFCFFQCLVVTADGRMALLTRSADLRQARHTSIIADVRIWKDAADANPALDLKRPLRRARARRQAPRRRVRELRARRLERPQARGGLRRLRARLPMPRISSRACGP